MSQEDIRTLKDHPEMRRLLAFHAKLQKTKKSQQANKKMLQEVGGAISDVSKEIDTLKSKQNEKVKLRQTGSKGMRLSIPKKK